MSYKKKKIPEADKMIFWEKDLRTICRMLNRLINYGAGIVFDMNTVQWWYTDDLYIDFNDKLGKFQVCKKFRGWKAPVDKLTITISDIQ